MFQYSSLESSYTILGGEVKIIVCSQTDETICVPLAQTSQKVSEITYLYADKIVQQTLLFYFWYIAKTYTYNIQYKTWRYYSKYSKLNRQIKAGLVEYNYNFFRLNSLFHALLTIRMTTGLCFSL